MKTIVVLGMHRSATSLLARGLYKSGVFMGHSLLGKTECNPWGHFEDIKLINLNDKILDAAGGSWDNPPNELDIYEAGYEIRDEIKAAVKKRERKLWGWKDPRTTLTIRCYQPFLKNPIYMSCVRDPKEVAESLKRRDNMPIDAGIELAKEYNKRMLKFLSEQT